MTVWKSADSKADEGLPGDLWLQPIDQGRARAGRCRNAEEFDDGGGRKRLAGAGGHLSSGSCRRLHCRLELWMALSVGGGAKEKRSLLAQIWAGRSCLPAVACGRRPDGRVEGEGRRSSRTCSVTGRFAEVGCDLAVTAVSSVREQR